MRDILFRGKTTGGEWVYGSLIKTGNFCCILSDDDGSDYNYPYLDNLTGCIDGYATPVIPETVGQWTGKFDKHHTKIFEGDIVRARMDYGPAGFCEVDAVSIGWHDEHSGYQWQYFDMNSIEVISNVYDNPELLKGE